MKNPLKRWISVITDQRFMLGVVAVATLLNAVLTFSLLRVANEVNKEGFSSDSAGRPIVRTTVTEHLAAIDESTRDMKETLDKMKDAIEEIKTDGVKINR